MMEDRKTAENWSRWANALRTTRRRQCARRLRHNDTSCCLDIAMREFGERFTDAHQAGLPLLGGAVAEAIGSRNPHLPVAGMGASAANDCLGLSFEEIAYLVDVGAAIRLGLDVDARCAEFDGDGE